MTNAASPVSPHPIRVLIVDDQQLVRAGFGKLLDDQPDLVVIGDAADGLQAIERTARLRPDVVLMDIRMPHLDGLAATARILDTPPPRPKVLILSTFDLDEYVFQALRAGASGFLLKDAPPEQLIAAIHVIAAGDALLAPAITRRLVEEFTRRAAPPPPQAFGLDRLTPRETDVLRLVGRGLSNHEIAAELYLGEATIKTHLRNLLAKLALRDRVQAVVLAYESGLINPGDTPHH
jgi:DNA-binding NarL/FixJ family response regulator